MAWIDHLGIKIKGLEEESIREVYWIFYLTMPRVPNTKTPDILTQLTSIACPTSISNVTTQKHVIQRLKRSHGRTWASFGKRNSSSPKLEAAMFFTLGLFALGWKTLLFPVTSLYITSGFSFEDVLAFSLGSLCRKQFTFKIIGLSLMPFFHK